MIYLLALLVLPAGAAPPGTVQVCHRASNGRIVPLLVASSAWPAHQAHGDLPPGTWYRDGDADGHGAIDGVVAACVPPAGTVVTAGDCDDADPAIHPGALETCDERDEDCDGAV